MPVDYPKELRKAYWDKHKPLLAKTKKTGIGEALKALEDKHDKVKWSNYDAQGLIENVDKKLKEWPNVFKDELKPFADEAEEIEKLAKKWAVDFKKEKLMPKSAAETCSEIATAAKTYASDILDFEGFHAKALTEKRKSSVETVKKMLKPSLTKTYNKCDGLIKDIVAYAKNPTKENFFNYFSGDSNARGYTTGCKNWDQLLLEFPEIRKECYDGSAMKDYFPCMEDYGANWDEHKFEEKVNTKIKATGEAIWRWHAIHLVKSVPKVKEFQSILGKALKMID